MNEQLLNLRHQIHKHPELSNAEYLTAERIFNFVQDYNPDEVIKLGKTSLAFVFDGKAEGETLVFRAELDALPIPEQSDLVYTSVIEHVAHSCGHDGHMTILAGLIQKVAENRPKKGRVVMLFQAAEEVGQGALDVVNNPKFIHLNPSYMFALHNVPGFEKHSIVVKSGSFAAASKGMTIKLTGKTSHAAEPQDGISPADAVSEIIEKLHGIRDNNDLFKDFVLLTIIHVQMGEIAFGTSPGYAEIRVTLRAFENEDMTTLTTKSEGFVRGIATAENLSCDISYSESFPATVNENNSVALVEQAAMVNDLNIKAIEKPFKWSEDFGYFSAQYKTCYFGLGSGINQAQLHNPDYDFPDDIISTGVNMFFAIYKKKLIDA